jgi:uncharacterized protein (TIGR02118 family)
VIKLIFCLWRAPSLSREAFQQYWLEIHAPLVRRHSAALRIRRYVQSHGFSDPSLARTAEIRNGDNEPFDGVAELWWDSLDDIVRAGDTREGRAAGRSLLEDERNFIDLSRSTLTYAMEREIISPEISEGSEQPSKA